MTLVVSKLEDGRAFIVSSKPQHEEAAPYTACQSSMKQQHPGQHAKAN